MDNDCTTNDPNVEVIRESLRDIASSERKSHRITITNSNRPALGEIVENEDYTEEFVISRGTILKKKTLPAQEYRRLQNALIQSEDNINSFLKIDGILVALVRDLSSNDPEAQLNAASCCCNIALGNTKACTALAKSITPYLLADLESLNYPLLDVCIWTIGNLITGSEKACEILHAQGLSKHLIILMRDCDVTILPSVIYTTTHYLKQAFHQVSESEMLELTQAVMKRDNFYKDANFIWLLALLSSSAIEKNPIISGLPAIVDYLYTALKDELIDVSKVTATIRILGNAISRPSEKNTDVLLCNPKYSQVDLLELLHRLLSHQHTHIRKETLWLLGNLYNHPSLDVQLIVKEMIPALSSLKMALQSIQEYSLVTTGT